jgi:hypothetical protein
MAPYKNKHRSNKIIDSQTHYSEIGGGDHARVLQVQHVTGNCQNYPDPSQGHQRTTSISVSPAAAAAAEFIRPATAKRAKKSGWGRVLPPYNVGPEEAEVHEIHDMRGEIQQEEMVPQSFKTKIQAVSKIIRHTESDHPKQYATSHRSSVPYARGSIIMILSLHIIFVYTLHNTAELNQGSLERRRLELKDKVFFVFMWSDLVVQVRSQVHCTSLI